MVLPVLVALRSAQGHTFGDGRRLRGQEEVHQLSWRNIPLRLRRRFYLPPQGLSGGMPFD